MTSRRILKSQLETVARLCDCSAVIDWDILLCELNVAKAMMRTLKRAEDGLEEVEEEEERPTKRPANYIDYDQHPLEKFGFE